MATAVVMPQMGESIAEGTVVRGSEKVGEAVVRMLLDHPALRGCALQWLSTRDAQSFYARLGFVMREDLPPKPYASFDMARAGTTVTLCAWGSARWPHRSGLP